MATILQHNFSTKRDFAFKFFLGGPIIMWNLIINAISYSVILNFHQYLAGYMIGSRRKPSYSRHLDIDVHCAATFDAIYDEECKKCRTKCFCNQFKKQVTLARKKIIIIFVTIFLKIHYCLYLNLKSL